MFFENPEFEQYESFREKAVVVFVMDGENVLLIVKKRGMGKGKVNGPGGKVEAGESFLEAGIRETREEVGLHVSDLRHGASLGFYFEDGYSLYVQAFFTRTWAGELVETDEASPFWCPIVDIPWDRMWDDDRLWLPQAMEGGYMEGIFSFRDETMTASQLSERPETRAISRASTKR